MSKLERVKVEVTQKHINKGNRGNIEFCPIARSLKDRGFNDVLVQESMTREIES